jgi:hypothetical protein
MISASYRTKYCSQSGTARTFQFASLRCDGPSILKYYKMDLCIDTMICIHTLLFLIISDTLLGNVNRDFSRIVHRWIVIGSFLTLKDSVLGKDCCLVPHVLGAFNQNGLIFRAVDNTVRQLESGQFCLHLVYGTCRDRRGIIYIARACREPVSPL